MFLRILEEFGQFNRGSLYTRDADEALANPNLPHVFILLPLTLASFKMSNLLKVTRN
jgi:hypothetical protein